MRMLKIDLDVRPATQLLSEWIRTRKVLLKELGYTPKSIDWFETKRGYHVYILLEVDVSDAEANILQFLLGDDHTRVKINFWRIEHKVKRWNKLFHDVLYRRKAKVLTCHYCGNRIPVPDKWFK